MKSKFESVLMDYGSQIMAIIFHYALQTERYEDCSVIRDLFQKYHLNLNQSIEEYQAEFWKLGLSGRTAIANLNDYLSEAMSLVGYPSDAVVIEKTCAL